MTRNLIQVTPDEVAGWCSHFDHKLDEGACVRISATAEMYGWARGNSNKKRRPMPVTAALRILAARANAARPHWVQKSESGAISVEKAAERVAWIDQLSAVLNIHHGILAEWLMEDAVQVTTLGHHVHGRNLANLIGKEMRAAGFTEIGDGSDSPLVKAVLQALKAIGQKQTVTMTSVSKDLRKNRPPNGWGIDFPN